MPRDKRTTVAQLTATEQGGDVRARMRHGADVVIMGTQGELDQYLASLGVDGETFPDVYDPRQVAGRDVYGRLPIHLGAFANTVVVPDLRFVPPHLRRGGRVTVATLEAFDVPLVPYIVRRLVP